MSNTPTERFSNRAETYLKYRPHYPPEIIGLLEREAGLTPSWRIADLGSGTGFLSERFLENGNTVYGVEPNGPMRETGEQYLSNFGAKFVSIDAAAEATGLEAGSIDLVTAGQAFHWFEPEEACRECRRILKPDGWVALIWNERRVDDDAVQAGYEAIFREFGTDYDTLQFQHVVDEKYLNGFLAPGWTLLELPNNQTLSLEELLGRAQSTSYSPDPESPSFGPMMAALERLFEEEQQGGKVSMSYRTKIYLGKVQDAT